MNYQEAIVLVLKGVAPLPPVRLRLGQEMGKILGLVAAEALRAKEPIPPFTNSAMDGYCFRWEDVPACGKACLKVAGELSAGQVPQGALLPGTALRIMTGAPLPEGADTVIPVEYTTQDQDRHEVLFQSVPERGANIRLAGEDIPAGGPVLDAGDILHPGAIGVLASTGFAEVLVHPRARVAVLTTGDELVDCAEVPGPGQIRDANLHALCAQITAFGAIPVPYPRISDNREAVKKALLNALSACDMVLTTGGVSMGDYDFVRPALEEIRAEKVFWRVAQKPGGPLGFWRQDGKPVFGIPGNPVAAMVMAEEYVRPALRKMMGFRLLWRPEVWATLDSPWGKRPDGKAHFLRVILENRGGEYHALLTGPQGSGILSSMLRANAIAITGEDETAIPAGGRIRVHLTEAGEDH